MKPVFFLLFMGLFFSCSDPKADLVKEIESLSLEMKAEEFPSMANMDKIVALYDEYINAYPDDEASLSYMELKAKYIAASGNYPEAIAAYDDILAQFPEGDRKADALFMQAFLYENNMADPGAAEAKYQKFIQLYPNHELADDAKFALENLSLSDEELFEKLMQMQGDSVALDSL